MARLFIFVAFSALALVGCKHDGDASMGNHSNKAAAKSSTPTVGPGNTPKAASGPAAADLKKFWFESPYEPKGKRVWTRVGPDKWDEKAADGTVSHYTGSDQYDMGGYHGVVVRGGPDDLNILIPDGGKGQIVRFREAAGGRNWSLLGPIEGVE